MAPHSHGPHGAHSHGPGGHTHTHRPAELDFGPEPTTTDYTPPEQSGLVAVRPYPNPGDVCQVIGENDVTRDLLDDASLLIGCPKHESGAILDRCRRAQTSLPLPAIGPY